jgi:hypothetical protein
MLKRFRTVPTLVTLLFMAGCLLGLAAQPLSAQVTIPSGSVINSAVLSVYVYTPTGRQVDVHRITAEWAETVVTYNSFNNSYDGAVFGSFVADAVGWEDVDITGLVQAWAAGTYPNYGVALVESQQWDSAAFTYYYSSDWGNVTLRPKLALTYTPPGGSPVSVTIQRPGSAAEEVVDTFLISTEAEAGLNYGTEAYLLSRYYGLLNKYSLVRFIFTFTPPTCPGTGTPGYWMNHPEAWEDVTISFCGLPLDHATAIEWMKNPVSGDTWFILFPAWLSAKLNASLGCPTVCPPDINIGLAITQAEAWLCTYQGTIVPAGGKHSPWRIGEPLYLLLDQYNNGLLCVPHRD